MPQCCNGCFYVDTVPDVIDKSSCWDVVCCRKCCKNNPSDCIDNVCGKCTMNCCPCCPQCEDFRYRCCVFACCWNNCIWDPIAFCYGPYKGDFNLLKKKIDERKGQKGAPESQEMSQ